ncbi:spore germination protein [Sulfobacillus acidophilus TPY]|uniref:Spore germination protein n=1 Tax=Sulfobacillus acidophilus (strain ATCC 700253 / DSM 10332 / NAL) TaxID=679936 RepID=G8TZS9_SULAD|nr:spore germination protein [Sulfobacillus acidophilus TPY]AEW06409.1 Spore germination protein [Sulfobacillus acidophilus DSM 10332]
MNIRISLRQLTGIQMMSILPTTLVFLPGLTFHTATTGAFYAVLLASVVGWALNRIITRSCLGESPVTGFPAHFGPFLGRILLGIYGLGITTGLISIGNELMTFIQASVLPRTPDWAIAGLVWPVAWVLADGGYEGIARMTDILVIGFIVVSLVVALPLFGYIRLSHFVPYWPPQGSTLLAAVWIPASFLGETVIGVAFVDGARDLSPKARQQALMAGAWLTTDIFIGLIMTLWGVLGAQFAAQTTFPLLEAIRDIRVGQFLSRFDLLFVPLWVGLIELKLGIWIFAAGTALARSVGIGPIRLWFGLVSFVPLVMAALLFPSVAGRISFLRWSWADTAYPTLVLVMGLHGLVGWIKRRHAHG